MAANPSMVLPQASSPYFIKPPVQDTKGHYDEDPALQF